MHPALIDRAMAQTYAAGMRYAVIPLPWMAEWAEYALTVGTLLAEHEPNICGVRKSHPGGVRYEDVLDDEGNVILCLYKTGHDGPCGFENHQQPQG